MTPEQIRSKFWTLRDKIAKFENMTMDRQIGLLNAEMAAETAAQLAEMNAILKRIGVLNWEEFALRLQDYFQKDRGLNGQATTI